MTANSDRDQTNEHGKHGRGQSRSAANASRNTYHAQMIQAAQRSHPRPIHAPPRQPLNETPDESEPSYSYEENSFLASFEEDKFHAVLSQQKYRTHGGRNGRGGNVGAPRSANAMDNNHHHLPERNTDDNEGASGGFFTTTSRQAASIASPSTSSNRLGNRYQNTSDGSSRATNKGILNRSFNNKNRSGNRALRGKRFDESNDLYEGPGEDTHKHGGKGNKKGVIGAEKKLAGERSSRSCMERFYHSNSSSSLASIGSNNSNSGKIRSKQRDEIRRLKLGAQQQGGDDNGYYHEVPTVSRHSNRNGNQNDGSRRNGKSSKMSALEEEMSGDNWTTDDSLDDYDNVTENDGVHTYLHSNSNGAIPTASKLKYPQNSTRSSFQNEHCQQRPPSTPLASAAGSIAAALAEYHSKKNNECKHVSADNQRSSLTQHIYNQSSPPPLLPQPQIHVPDDTDNRSTTSTMSDLSMTDSNTNNRQQSSSAINGSNILHRKMTPHHQQQTSWKHGQFHGQLQGTRNPQQFSTMPGSIFGGPGTAHHALSGGMIGSQSHALPHRVESAQGSENCIRTNRFIGANTLTDETPFVPTSPIHLNDNHQATSTDDNNFTNPIGSSNAIVHRHEIHNNIRTTSNELRTKIATMIDACEARRRPFKKKLMLNNLNMTAADIPINDLYETVLGRSLHKLSLSGNRLSTIPRKLVSCLPVLKTMDISECQLYHLPERWNLPNLRRLILSHNRLNDFPEETMLEGLLELQELDMFGNEVSMIVIPQNPKLLCRLEILDMGYNDLSQLPEELDRLKSLKQLKVMNNYLEVIPMRVCNMDLRMIDASNNPVRQPPIETCERGIGSMKRYYHSISGEDSTRRKQRLKLNLLKGKRTIKTQTSFGRRHSDDSTQLSNSKLHSSQFNEDRRRSASDAKSSAMVSIFADSRTSAIPESSRTLVLPKRTEKVDTKNIIGASSTNRKSKSIETDASLETHFPSNNQIEHDEVTINETLKVIFVGMDMAGKTSMIKRLIQGEDAEIPNRDQRTIGVDIYQWDPTIDKRYEHVDNRIMLQDEELKELCPDTNVKFSVWDFAGQDVYHATHELFFSPRALYIVVWDMGANNPATKHYVRHIEDNDHGSDDEFESDKDDERRAVRALEQDIDEKVQFWIDCIQSSVPGAVILPVATFDDLFEENDHHEAKRRCNVLKERLQMHERRSIKGIQERLRKYIDENMARDKAAVRLRKLLQSNSRPKIIFGNDGEDSVVRVSGTKYTGFAKLTEKINNIATGRDSATHKRPLFGGHVGVRIPRMRLTVQNVVRKMRQNFKVIDWGSFFEELKKNGINDVEDVSDALHFLTEIGELSYFGNVLPDSTQNNHGTQTENIPNHSGDDMTARTDEDDDDTVWPVTIYGVATRTKDDFRSDHYNHSLADLSQFIFLNPRWLVQAVACILRHDLVTKIQEVRRDLSIQDQTTPRPTFNEATVNCPVITSEDAYMLWQDKQVTRKAAELVEYNAAGTKLKPFEFLQLLLVRFRIFIPIDLGIEKVFLGGIEHSQKTIDKEPQQTAETKSFDDVRFSGAKNRIDIFKSTNFFLPSLLLPGELTEAWTYMTKKSYTTTVCHSFLFEDGVPPGLMERITASVLSNIYAITHRQDTDDSALRAITETITGPLPFSPEGIISVKEVLCWRSAFLLKLKLTWTPIHGEEKSSINEIFTALVDKDSNYCVGSSKMSVGSRRLVTSCKGPVADGGKLIWTGGYLVVLSSIMKVLEEYGGVVFEKHGFCPICMVKRSVSEASFWDVAKVERAINEGETDIRCHHAHNVDLRLVCPRAYLNHDNSQDDSLKMRGDIQSHSVSQNNDYLRGVVLIGLWDGKYVTKAGSGFIVDSKLGLIVTASHTLINIHRKNDTFGKNYLGMPHGRVVVGILLQEGTGEYNKCVFRYFAKIVEKDPALKDGVSHVDACVLAITTRMENDVGGGGEGCVDQHEKVLENNPNALKNQKLHSLKVAYNKPQNEEDVTIAGYSQGGESLLEPGAVLNRNISVQKGYVNGIWTLEGNKDMLPPGFQPREEIIVECDTIMGHSGGPCVNRQKEVFGILCRADLIGRRCYVVPISEIEPLIKRAKKSLRKISTHASRSRTKRM